jgi:uncharacterized protein with HEPN domain
MSALTDTDRLRHMLEYAEKALSFAEGRSRAEVDTDPQFRYAVQYAIFVIGEAASRVSDATKVRYPQIPWTPIIRMRNWIGHGYTDLSPDILWKTLHESLPDLINMLLEIIPPGQT